jgi:hypothetical protein
MNSSPHWSGCLLDRRRLGRITLWMLALALTWQAPAPAIAQDACGDYAVAIAPQPPGQPLSENIVSLMTADGELASGAFEEPLTVEPSPKQGVALVRSLGGIFGLMDVASGEISPLQIPDVEQRSLTATFSTIRNAPKSDFMLLSEIPNAVWLVDLSSGDALDLTTLGGEDMRFIESAQISPDGGWLIFFAQDGGFLISLKTPGDPTPIISEPMLPFPSFDANSDVIYAVQAGGAVSIRSLEPETGTHTQLAFTPSARLLPLDLAAQLIVIADSSLLALEDGSAPVTLFQWQGDPEAILSNEAGTHLLVSDERDGATRWYQIEVTTGATRELHELENLSPITSASRRNSVLFAPTVRTGEGVPGAPYRTVDLTTGAIATVLEQDSEEVWQAIAAGDDAGRYMLVNAVSPGSGRLWLIDTQAGTAAQIGTSSGNAKAVVSPDGCQVAVSNYDTSGEGRISSVTVSSLVDGTTILTLPDALLLGWADR